MQTSLQPQSLNYAALQAQGVFTQPVCCPVCNGTSFTYQEVLWKELIETWELLPSEVELINLQQGYACQTCRANLRSMTLAAAWLECLDWNGSLQALVMTPQVQTLQVLEINEAGTLHPFLSRIPHHTFAAFPSVDMQQLPMPNDSFDFIFHSDTLEHVPDPRKGLAECLRVLRPGGCMLMTIPIVHTRLTRQRNQLPPSFHGQSGHMALDYLVQTEYGADFYTDLIKTGWFKITLYSLAGLASLAVIGMK